MYLKVTQPRQNICMHSGTRSKTLCGTTSATQLALRGFQLQDHFVKAAFYFPSGSFEFLNSSLDTGFVLNFCYRGLENDWRIFSTLSAPTGNTCSMLCQEYGLLTIVLSLYTLHHCLINSDLYSHHKKVSVQLYRLLLQSV